VHHQQFLVFLVLPVLLLPFLLLLNLVNNFITAIFIV